MALDPRSLAWATLAHKALPQRALVALLRAFGDPAAVLAASRATLMRAVPGPVAELVSTPLAAGDLESTSRWLEDPEHRIIAWDDDDYPRALLELGDAPPVLFHIGRRDLLGRPAFAIVGSRNATPQGLATARDFARAIGDAGFTIVSGLALGIDGAAHQGALGSAGSTLAVVGTGLDRVYPARHRDLAAAIAHDGALISEYVPGTPARKEHFPRRNRLISGLARGVLVVEATLSSGSLITARLAGEQGRDVFAIPGSIHSPFSKGCHKLIREGAKLVETAQDVLDELRPQNAAVARNATAVGVPGGTSDPAVTASTHATRSDATPLLAAMGFDPVSVDALVERTGIAPESITAELVRLELVGRVAAMPGGRWQRLPDDAH